MFYADRLVLQDRRLAKSWSGLHLPEKDVYKWTLKFQMNPFRYNSPFWYQLSPTYLKHFVKIKSVIYIMIRTITGYYDDSRNLEYNSWTPTQGVKIIVCVKFEQSCSFFYTFCHLLIFILLHCEYVISYQYAFKKTFFFFFFFAFLSWYTLFMLSHLIKFENYCFILILSFVFTEI